MSRTNRNSISRIRHDDIHLDDPLYDLDDQLEHHPELVPVDVAMGAPDPRVVLDAVIRAHRWQLVAAARHHLRNRRMDAEDVVQDVCLEALEGQIALSTDPTEAYADLLREVVARCKGGDE
jgi:hypothetical protein